MHYHDRAVTAAGMTATAGSVLLTVGTWLHPMGADPNDASAAFTEYAADSFWVASHLMQLAGMALMIVSLVLISPLLEAGPAAAWARIARAGAIAGLALAAALQAVDGVALKTMVDAWAAAPESAKSELFYSAFAVRQVETGLASMLSLVLGLAVTIYGIAMCIDSRFGKGLGCMAIAGGVPTSVAGVLMAHTGFSDATMIVNMPANALLLLWMLALGRRLSRLAHEPQGELAQRGGPTA
jgi:hypothetical protein